MRDQDQHTTSDFDFLDEIAFIEDDNEEMMWSSLDSYGAYDYDEDYEPETTLIDKIGEAVSLNMPEDYLAEEMNEWEAETERLYQASDAVAGSLDEASRFNRRRRDSRRHRKDRQQAKQSLRLVDTEFVRL